MAKKFVLTINKGGTLKTTTTVQLGHYLAKKGKKVLLIDLDPQGSLTTSLGIREPENTVYQGLKEGEKLIPIQGRENLWILPSTIDLSAAELELSARMGREHILKNKLQALNKKFDVVLIDTPPSIGLLTINALATADYAIIPTEPTFLSLKGIHTLISEVIEKIKQFINPKLKVGGILITKYDNRRILDKSVVEGIRKSFNKELFNTKIRFNTAMGEAPSAGKTIFEYSPKSNGAIDYTSFGEEFIERFLR